LRELKTIQQKGKKQRMKMITKTVLIAGLAAFIATPVLAASHGSDVLHVKNTKEAMVNTGIEPDAAGTVSFSQAKQGSANNQKLDVLVSGLTPDTDYTLSGTADGAATDLTTFTTDGNGRASVHLRGSSSGHGGGHGSAPLPDGFELSHMTELDVVNGSAQAVLSSDTTQPAKFQYLVKKNISGDTASGVLQIKATEKKTKFNLTATGLEPDTDYQLFINGTPVQTNTTDSHGRLKINSATLPDNIFEVTSVEVQDLGGTPVLSTTVP
jgi:hypothetical protein